MGLDDDSFSIVLHQILALESLPSLDKIFNMVQQEENHKKIMTGCDTRQETTGAFTVTHQVKSLNSQEGPHANIVGCTDMTKVAVLNW